MYDEKVYFLSMAGENLFNMERSYKATCSYCVNDIVESGIITNIECFKNTAMSGSNPRRFVSFNNSYVIFIYKKDKFKEGLPIYHIDRYVRETGKLFEDGSHIIYVNGSYKGEGEIAQLIEDFHQKESEDMHYKALADGVKHFKETEEGFWMSGGHPVRTDRSEAKTVKLCVNQ